MDYLVALILFSGPLVYLITLITTLGFILFLLRKKERMVTSLEKVQPSKYFRLISYPI